MSAPKIIDHPTASTRSDDCLVSRFAFDAAIVLTESVMRSDWKEMAIYEDRSTAERMCFLNPDCITRVREIKGQWNCQCHGPAKTKCECGSATMFIPDNSKITDQRNNPKE